VVEDASKDARFAANRLSPMRRISASTRVCHSCIAVRRLGRYACSTSNPGRSTPSNSKSFASGHTG